MLHLENTHGVEYSSRRGTVGLVCDPTAKAMAGKSVTKTNTKKRTDIPVECVMFPEFMLVSKQDEDSTAKHHSHASQRLMLESSTLEVVKCPCH